ncbi:MAG TPA: prolipoprotein diacylglyceryl transferase [Bryobacteraceae bacterium]|nr:prolipoprotein diacylglyceryl transferase [Bryobacteraceae bacterium]
MLPKLIDAGSFYLPTYGVMVATAFLIAIWVTGKLAKRAGLASETITNLAIYCALVGMLGAKLAMFAFDWRLYLGEPSQIFTVETLQAAGVYQGGLLLAIGFAIVYMRRNGLPAWLTTDVFAPGLALGHAIGRLGCLAAGCCWGAVCHRPWAITFTKPDAHELTGVPLGIPLHPTQLYESLAEFAIFGFLYHRFGRRRRDGEILGWYLVLYSSVRLVVEFFRNHEQSLVAGLSLTQWISLTTLVAGIWLLLRPSRLTTAPSYVAGQVK